MTRFAALSAALLMTAGAATAQVTTQEAVGGASGIAEYPTTVLGANGVTYACQAPTVIDGVTARRCITPNAGGAGFASMSPAAIAGAAAVIVAIGVIANNDDDAASTTTTN